MNLTLIDLVKVSGRRDRAGDHILVHSSLSLGWVEDGANTVIDADRGRGRTGTVIFPTLTGCPDDSPEHPPVFDARHTRCWTGTIPDTARRRPDALRSLHPTHSVAAIGRLAEWITAGHHLVRTPCGCGSPYDKLADIGGKIVLIGVTECINTSFHHAEELAEVPFVCLGTPMDITLTDIEGREVRMRDTYLHRWGGARDFEFLERAMIDLGICRVRQVGDASVRVIDANFQRMFLVRKLLDDPLATLALSERGNWK